MSRVQICASAAAVFSCVRSGLRSGNMLAVSARRPDVSDRSKSLFSSANRRDVQGRRSVASVVIGPAERFPI